MVPGRETEAMTEAAVQVLMIRTNADISSGELDYVVNVAIRAALGVRSREIIHRSEK